MSVKSELNIRIRAPNTNAVKTIDFLNESSTMSDLYEIVSSLIEIPVFELKILSGYPPKMLEGCKNSTLQEIGVRNNELLIAAIRNPTDLPQYSLTESKSAIKGEASSASSSKDIILPSTNGSNMMPTCTKLTIGPDFKECSINDLANQATTANLTKSKCKTSYLNNPSKAANSSDSSTVEISVGASQKNCSATEGVKFETGQKDVILPSDGQHGLLLKREVPSDNSCLFASMDYVLNGKISHERTQNLRHLVSELIVSRTDIISDFVLDRPRTEYSEWIKRPQSWGGEIELALLSNHFSIEIVAVDARSGRANRFGEAEQYCERVFLLFDGIHYDPLHMHVQEQDRFYTKFPADLDYLLVQAVELAQQVHGAGQFTDTNRFRLMCGDCMTVITGEAEAQRHARTTGHTNFQEVRS